MERRHKFPCQTPVRLAFALALKLFSAPAHPSATFGAYPIQNAGNHISRRPSIAQLYQGHSSPHQQDPLSYHHVCCTSGTKNAESETQFEQIAMVWMELKPGSKRKQQRIWQTRRMRVPLQSCPRSERSVLRRSSRAWPPIGLHPGVVPVSAENCHASRNADICPLQDCPADSEFMISTQPGTPCPSSLTKKASCAELHHSLAKIRSN